MKRKCLKKGVIFDPYFTPGPSPFWQLPATKLPRRTIRPRKKTR
jgi:hypothetical protein